MSKPVCVIVGVGPGNGLSFAQKDDIAAAVFFLVQQPQ